MFAVKIKPDGLQRDFDFMVTLFKETYIDPSPKNIFMQASCACNYIYLHEDLRFKVLYINVYKM